MMENYAMMNNGKIKYQIEVTVNLILNVNLSVALGKFKSYMPTRHIACVQLIRCAQAICLMGNCDLNFPVATLRFTFIEKCNTLHSG